MRAAAGLGVAVGGVWVEAARVAIGSGVAGCRSASSMTAIVGVGAAAAAVGLGSAAAVAGKGACAPAGAVSLRHPASAAMPIRSAIAIRQRLIYDR